MQEQMRAKAKELLEGKQVQCVIGYEIGSRGQVRPAFIYQADDVDRLVWNQGCTHNLTTYLRDKQRPTRKGEQPPQVAIVVKPCDSRALNVLVAETQIERERVYVIGVTCDGIVARPGDQETRRPRCWR